MSEYEQQKINYYRAYLRMHCSMLMDLTACDDYIFKLIHNDNLSNLETALRNWIQNCPKD